MTATPGQAAGEVAEAPFRVWMHEVGHDPDDMRTYYGVGAMAEAFQGGTQAAIAAQEPHAAPGEADCTVCAQVGGPHGVPADNSILLSGPRSEGVPAPELRAAMAEPRELRKVITELLSMFRAISGGYGARTSSSRLRKIAARAGVHWDGLTLPAPDTTEAAEAEQLREQLGVLQDSIGNLAAGLKLSAGASRPSKKSDIEDGCARALLGLLDPR